MSMVLEWLAWLKDGKHSPKTKILNLMDFQIILFVLKKIRANISCIKYFSVTLILRGKKSNEETNRVMRSY